jgi:hypothetical protein
MGFRRYTTSGDRRRRPGRGGPWHRPALPGAVANLVAGTLFGWSLVAQSVSAAVTMSRRNAA